MTDYAISISFGILLGIFSFVSANRFAHQNKEASMLWLLFECIAILTLGYMGIAIRYVLLLFIWVIGLGLVLRKILRHRKKERFLVAESYQKWGFIFTLSLLVIALMWKLMPFDRL